VLGPDNAPITIIEFSDYECPYCKRWHDDSFERLIETFPDEVRFVYRDFPLTNIHPNAAPAAEAANCAHEQGRFWDFHRKLFSTTLLNHQVYLSYAEELGLDQAAFEECVSSRRYQDEVIADLEWAINLGISSTPTFFINGIAIVGAQPLKSSTKSSRKSWPARSPEPYYPFCDPNHLNLPESSILRLAINDGYRPERRFI
jgi:protein-disulfide isomerase